MKRWTAIENIINAQTFVEPGISKPFIMNLAHTWERRGYDWVRTNGGGVEIREDHIHNVLTAIKTSNGLTQELTWQYMNALVPDDDELRTFVSNVLAQLHTRGRDWLAQCDDTFLVREDHIETINSIIKIWGEGATI
ncbi:hypothetical protein [Bifidobacterium aquikefiri]|uniref:hypothetical protein n=1 Tax=Bifidobacterium aquikefiri TaxID=1653207 RepID=UPI0039EB10B9